MFYLCPRPKQAARLTPGTSSGAAAWVGSTGSSKGHSVSTTETLCHYLHLESIHLPVFFFTNVFLCSESVGTLPLQWHNDVSDKTTSYPCLLVPQQLDVKSSLCFFIPAKSDLQYQGTPSYRNSICFLVRFYSCSPSTFFLDPRANLN